MQYIYKTEQCSAAKGMSADTATTWVSLENMPTNISPPQRNAYWFYDFIHMECPEQANLETESELGVAGHGWNQQDDS